MKINENMKKVINRWCFGVSAKNGVPKLPEAFWLTKRNELSCSSNSWNMNHLHVKFANNSLDIR